MDNYEELYKKVIDSDYNYGTGSWAFLNDNIKMCLDEYGEYVPILKEGAIIDNSEIKKFLKVNTFYNSTINEKVISKNLFSQTENIKYDSNLGYYSNLYAGHVVEGKFRENGSSGGFGTWILKELFEKKEIDKIIHVKESCKEDKLFEYQISNTTEEIISGSKTKYYPVEFSEVLKIVRDTPGKYAIVGVPSFIMTYHLLCEVEPILKERVKYTIGLICGHQKSSKFAEYLAWQSGIKPGDLKYVNFRKKDPKSPSDNYNIEFIGNIDGEEVRIEKKMLDLNGRNWGQGFFKLRASDFNDDVMNETADITLGDAWLPEYTKDSLGTNVLIVRNPVIQKIIDEGIINKTINLDVLSTDKIKQSQIAHFRHSRDELGYRLFKKQKSNQWIPNLRIEPDNKITYTRRKIQDLREDICIASKENYRMAVKKNDLMYFENKMTPLTNKYTRIYKYEYLKKLGIRGVLSKIFQKVLKK